MIETAYYIAKNAKKIPTIHVFHVSLPEQDYKEGAGV